MNEGARLLNENDIGSIRLADVAASLGITRNAIYYYIKSHNDLVAQCYLRSCERTAQTIEQAVKTTDDPSKQLRSFIELSIAGNGGEAAILNNVKSLSKPYRELVSRKFLSNINTLSQVVQDGQKAGTLKTVDTSLVTHMILSVIEYTIQMCKLGSTSEADFQKNRGDNSKPTANFLMDGFAKYLDINFKFPKYLEPELLSNFNPFNASDIKEQKRQELISAASLLFNQKGVLGTSIEEIGANLGVTKGAIYHHFRDKEELILACNTRAFDIYDSIIKIAGHSSEKGMEQIMTIFHLNCQAQAGRTPPMILSPGMYSLPDSLQCRVDSIRETFEKMLVLARSQGDAKDEAPVHGSTLGAHFFIQKWLSENDQLTGQQIADEMTRVVATGMCA